jgi:Tol biopolymer transport system component
MRLVALVGLLLTTAVTATAAERPGGGIAFISKAGLFSVGVDDGRPSAIREYVCTSSGTLCPTVREISWSPDGTRLAYTFGTDLYVFESESGTERRIAPGIEVDGGNRPAWSPDGRELAFVSARVEDITEPGRSGSSSSATSSTPSDLYAVNLDNGAVKRLTTGLQTTDVAWAPGRQIVYSALVQSRWELFIVDPGGEHRRLSDGYARLNRRASWSPDGTTIAFLRDGGSSEAHLNTIRADGTGLHELSTLPIDLVFGAQPAWSPDGTMLAVTTFANSPIDLLTGNRPGRDLYLVTTDGSGERRLTESGERGVSDRGATWSADGGRLAFESFDRDKPSESALYTVRADGRCEMRVATLEGWRAAWQPRPGFVISPPDCTDLAVVAAGGENAQAARVTVRLLNDGTTPLSRIRLRGGASAATIVSGFSPNARCSTRGGKLDCRLSSLPAGRSVDVDVLAEPRVLSRVSGRFVGPPIRFRASASDRELSLANNQLETELLTTSCSTGLRGSGVIQGTDRDNDICGRVGRDRILGLDGDDRIYAGSGNDVVKGDAGNDVITPGPGRDAVWCGGGRDRVVADRADRVARDCERVTRT